MPRDFPLTPTPRPLTWHTEGRLLEYGPHIVKRCETRTGARIAAWWLNRTL